MKKLDIWARAKNCLGFKEKVNCESTDSWTNIPSVEFRLDLYLKVDG